jgi:hypothetical protein
VKIRYGHYRFVLVFKNFVIKFPRIRLWSALKTGWREIHRKRLRWHLRKWTYRHMGTIPWCLYKGIVDNWLEYLFYRKKAL